MIVGSWGEGVVIVPVVNPGDVTYQYMYNGKELQGEFGLNNYDFGARNYDPALGRWMNIDPLELI
jgi:RHS repeat-associated protein